MKAKLGYKKMKGVHTWTCSKERDEEEMTSVYSYYSAKPWHTVRVEGQQL